MRMHAHMMGWDSDGNVGSAHRLGCHIREQGRLPRKQHRGGPQLNLHTLVDWDRQPKEPRHSCAFQGSVSWKADNHDNPGAADRTARVVTSKAGSDGTWKRRFEVQSPDMTKKVIPFPQAAPTVLPSLVGPRNRIILHIGRQCIVMDISCQATVLNPVPATVVKASAPGNNPGGKIRKPKR
jgi:hypothetical protein